MSFYDNIECPVCHKSFNDGDDIVTCPKCGTPHHRKCYEEVGHCANASKHAENFSFRRDAMQNKEEKKVYEPKVTPKDDVVRPNIFPNINTESQQGGKTKCVNCGEEIDKGTPFCYHCGARQPESNYSSFVPPLQDVSFAEEKVYENSDTTIDGEKISDVAAVVRTNTRAFIPKFVKNRKLSWNFCAFLFGPLYLFYRKMYKEGLVFLSIKFIANLVISSFFAKPLSAFYSAYTNYISNMSDKISNAQIYTDVQKMIEPVMPALLISIGVTLAIAIIIGFTANTMYRAKVLSVVKSVDSHLANGAMFEQTITMANGSAMSQGDMRKIYLAKSGGTNIIAPILAMLLMSLLQNII